MVTPRGGSNPAPALTLPTVFYQYMAAPLLLPFILTMFVVFICRTREGHQGLTLEDPTSLW